MTEAFDKLTALLPEAVRSPLQRLPREVRARVQEIRLRSGRAISVSIGGRERMITADGGFTVFAGGAAHCTAACLRQIVDRFCERSLYAHQEELRYGYITSPDGCRIGIAGTAVVENGRVIGYRQLTSLCLRVAREHRGCAETLAQVLCRDGVRSALICGEPSCGKTSLLRDLLNEFSARQLSVSVVDERGELAWRELPGCDILHGTPKREGVEHAVRCLAPQVIVFDELGTAEAEAVRGAVNSGVPVIASAHCRQVKELLQRDGIAALLRGGAFAYTVRMCGRDKPGEIAEILQTEVWLREIAGDAADCGRGNGLGPDDGASGA